MFGTFKKKLGSNFPTMHVLPLNSLQNNRNTELILCFWNLVHQIRRLDASLKGMIDDYRVVESLFELQSL